MNRSTDKLYEGWASDKDQVHESMDEEGKHVGVDNINQAKGTMMKQTTIEFKVDRDISAVKQQPTTSQGGWRVKA